MSGNSALDDAVEAALSLAITLKIDPFPLLERPPRMVFDVLARTNRIVEQMARDQDE